MRTVLLATAACVLAVGLASRTAFRDSCTVDEFGNLPLTMAFWRGALHIDPGNPPLTRWIQGIPLLAQRPDLGASPAELATIETSWDLGYRFEAAHRSDYHALLVRARLGSLALLVLTVIGVFTWARALGGVAAGTAAAVLAATSPNLLAHGRLVTPDIGLAALVVWSGFGIDRAARSSGIVRAALAGGLAGLTGLAKFSGLLLLPVGVVALAIASGTPRSRWIRPVVFGACALATIWAGYGFAPPGQLGVVPVPLPTPMVEGLSAQLAEPAYPAYLLGELREKGGWLHYYAVAFLVKTPLLALVLFALSAIVIVRERRSDFFLPLATAAFFFLALGLGTKKNIGLRYVLPVLPLLHVTAAALVRRGRARSLSWGLVLLVAVTGVVASGAPLSYLNGAGHLLSRERPVLVDSNLDWGQALPDLLRWQEREGVEEVQLAYFGRIDPSIYEVRWRSLPPEPVDGPVAISTTLAVGLPYLVRMQAGPSGPRSTMWSQRDTWAWLEDVPPDETLGGGSIRVWRSVETALAARRSRGGAANRE